MTEIFGLEVDPADVCRAQIVFDFASVADHLVVGRNPPVGGRSTFIAPEDQGMAAARVTVMMLLESIASSEIESALVDCVLCESVG